MARNPWDRPYYDWQVLPPFVIKNGVTVYPYFAPPRGDAAHAIWVFDRAVDPEDPEIEHRHLAHDRIAYLTWFSSEISYIATEPALQRQGIATEMLRLGRQIDPHLKHSTAHRTTAAQKWIAAVDPDELDTFVTPEESFRQATEASTSSAPRTGSRQCLPSVVHRIGTSLRAWARRD